MKKTTGFGRGKNPKSWGNHKSGEDHPRWNKDKIISSHGYVKVRVGKDHPLADPHGYAYEHSVVWFKAGRQMPSEREILHHRNENKQDNRIENLELLTRVEHAEKHFQMVSDSVVREIRIRYAAGEKGTELAKEFNLPHQRVYRFIRGETRVDAGGPIQTGRLGKATGHKVSKKAAGRLLDGREWNEVPHVKK